MAPPTDYDGCAILRLLGSSLALHYHHNIYLGNYHPLLRTSRVRRADYSAASHFRVFKRLPSLTVIVYKRPR